MLLSPTETVAVAGEAKRGERPSHCIGNTKPGLMAINLSMPGIGDLNHSPYRDTPPPRTFVENSGAYLPPV